MSVYDASGDHSSNKGWADTRGTTNTNQTRMFPMRSFKTRIRTTVSGAVIAASLFAVMANAQVAVSAFKPIPVGSGTLMVGSGGSISYCSGPIQTALSGTLFNLNLVGKCKNSIGSLPLPLSNWTAVGGTTGSVQFVSVNGEIILCGAFDITGNASVPLNPNQPYGTALASCVVRETVPK